MLTRLTMLGLGLLLLVVTALPAAAQGSAVMRLSAPTEAVPAGTSFEVRVSIEGAANLGSFQFTLGYDPTAVRAESARLGEFLGSTGRSANPLGPRINAQTGELTFGAFTLGQQKGPDGQGDLAVITVKALKQGTANLDLRDVQTTDISGITAPATAQGTQVEVAAAPGGGVPTGIILTAVLVVLAAAVAAFLVLRSQRPLAAEGSEEPAGPEETIVRTPSGGASDEKIGGQ
jgi:hypothetical protein